MSEIKIKSALISVFNKDRLEPIIKELNNQNVVIYSTGGTEKFINDLGVKVIKVEDLTSYPSILGGRVKTLHPKVFGGILNRQDNNNDQKELKDYEIPQIDLIIVVKSAALNHLLVVCQKRLLKKLILVGFH